MKRDRNCSASGARKHQRGFTMVEVLVSLIIIAVGMLGLAKISALAYASTGVASQQSLAALEAASMASAMRANHSYWSTVSLSTAFSYTANGTVPSASNTLPTTTNTCITSCSTTVLAELDVQNWVTAVNAVLPNPVSKINCAVPAASGSPPGCYIQVSWHEENIANNIAVSTLPATTYTLYVVP
jgi:type IV pilus assembly protein PilV